MLRDIGYERDWMTTAELTGKSKSHAHSWRLGVNFWWNRQGIQANTGVYAHTIEANPDWLNHNGSQEFAANTGGEYYDRHETKTAIYLSDDWQVTNRWWLSAGVRDEYYAMGGKNAYVYAMQTIGWTTDVVLTPFKGFTFHGLLTLQNPKYKNFDITANFSDGTSKKYNFNDKVTTGVSKTIIELDPSYQFDKFRVWASFRYQSKQYINKTNSLYFNGRWETFGGVDYNMNKHVGFSVNVVNILNQKGCSGSIGSADLIEDVSAYKNYLMAGSYIRPFTVEFAAHINF